MRGRWLVIHDCLTSWLVYIPQVTLIWLSQWPSIGDIDYVVYLYTRLWFDWKQCCKLFDWQQRTQYIFLYLLLQGDANENEQQLQAHEDQERDLEAESRSQHVQNQELEDVDLDDADSTENCDDTTPLNPWPCLLIKKKCHGVPILIH